MDTVWVDTGQSPSHLDLTKRSSPTDTYAHDVDTFTYAHKDFLPAFAAGNFG